jgi:hypothetical protein
MKTRLLALRLSAVAATQLALLQERGNWRTAGDAIGNAAWLLCTGVCTPEALEDARRGRGWAWRGVRGRGKDVFSRTDGIPRKLYVVRVTPMILRAMVLARRATGVECLAAAVEYAVVRLAESELTSEIYAETRAVPATAFPTLGRDRGRTFTP